ncbi:hypothetical protein [Fusobacterium sp. SYSU M8A802]
MKLKNLLIGTFAILTLVGCGGPDESTVKKYLPGTYTRETEPKNTAYYYKEITIKHLKGNEYRITCLDPDDISYIDKKVVVTPSTPDTFDIEISSIQLKQESNSIKQYYIKGFVTNIISNGTTFSYANQGINKTTGMTLVIAKDIVELTVAGKDISSTRKK